jgi:hypothetical protein
MRILFDSMVKRSAWWMVPVDASSARSNSGRIGKPAASAEVQSAGRSAFDRRSKPAAPKMFHTPGLGAYAW